MKTFPQTAENLDFPADFIWGGATSAYQIEGAASEDGRGESIWDRFAHTPGKVAGGDHGDVACDHYHRVKEDIALFAELGIKAYRFSISWPRVQPLGQGPWNEEGWAFYGRLLDELDAHCIKAHVTLFHWDLPQALEDKGGWRARETCTLFAAYAAEFVRRFGSRVTSIATHNEPFCTATLGHEIGVFAPGLKDRAAAAQVSHHLLLSHALALRAMREAGHQGPIGIVLNQSPSYPANPDSEADRREARYADGFINRWYMDPLLRGAYPADIVELLGADAPRVEAGDMELIRSPIDFLGINYYTRTWSSTSEPKRPAPNEMGVTDLGWEVHPQGLTEHLIRIARDYIPPPIVITENGAAFADVLEGSAVHDEARVAYLKSHISAVRQAMDQGADVRGYFAWSLMDNFEWAEGYAKRFGLIYVDYPSLRRIPKDSALWFRDFIRAQRG
ncbi:GH1 family beta-glucosidase [Niveibacterium terrae]|uniref:GH1 family beta-glucosidase n=1 Tax=Niveibacterium terrae TaxID=3373598 RepID=UPI003A9023FA